MATDVATRNADATCFIGNLDERTTDDMLWELFVQLGPVQSIHVPKDKITMKHQGYGFVEFRGETDAEYAIKVMNMVKVFGKPIVVKKTMTEKVQDVGANLYVGNLDSEVDEKSLYDTFSAFGGILGTPKIVRDVDTDESKGYGFVVYENFESADLAIQCMNEQFLGGRNVQVQYAFRKDAPGERHGSQAERLLASQSVASFKPHTLFSGGTDADAVGLPGSGGTPTSIVPPPPQALICQTRGVIQLVPPMYANAQNVPQGYGQQQQQQPMYNQGHNNNGHNGHNMEMNQGMNQGGGMGMGAPPVPMGYNNNMQLHQQQQGYGYNQGYQGQGHQGQGQYVPQPHMYQQQRMHQQQQMHYAPPPLPQHQQQQHHHQHQQQQYSVPPPPRSNQ